MNTADILDKAADLIDTRGWNQGHYVNESGGLDLDGALHAAVGMDPQRGTGMHRWPGWTQERELASNRTYAWLKRWFNRSETPIWWNDQAGRTKEEVVSTLRAAAQTARAEQ